MCFDRMDRAEARREREWEDMPKIGPMELLIILGIALLIFGPKNLPKLGKSLGKTVKSVRDGMDGKYDEDADAPVVVVQDPAPVAPPVVETPESKTE